MSKRTIEQFFKPKIMKPEEESRDKSSVQPTPNVGLPIDEGIGNNYPSTSSSSLLLGDESTTVPKVSVDLGLTSVDIGLVSDQLYASKHELSKTTDLKHKVLNDLFVPDENFNFPGTNVHNKNLKFQRSWLKRFNWLAYSKEKDGAYCKFCVLFANEFGGKGQHQKLESLVTQPFTKWKDAINRFTSHNNAKYHEFSSLRAENFMKVDCGQIEDIKNVLDTQRKKEIEQNRASLKPIIDTIILCGENEIPLRGHRDSGPLTIEKPSQKEGKF